MSNARAKAERSQAKDKRQGVTPTREKPIGAGGKRARAPRPYKVMMPAPQFSRDREPWVVHRCISLEHARQMLDKATRARVRGETVMWIEDDKGERIESIG